MPVLVPAIRERSKSHRRTEPRCRNDFSLLVHSLKAGLDGTGSKFLQILGPIRRCRAARRRHAGAAERAAWHSERRRAHIRRREIQYLRQIVRGVVADAERRQTETPFNHFQNRGVIVLAMCDEPALRVGRYDYAWHTKSQAAIGVPGGGRCRRNRREWRRNVIVKSAPLIVVDD